MKKWIIIVLVVGVVGWVVFDFIDKELESRAAKEEQKIEDEAKAKEQERKDAIAKRDAEREELVNGKGLSNEEESSQDDFEVSDDEAEEAEYGLQSGNKVPDFTLETMDGEDVSISDFEGKKVLLNFWATWCPPCRDEMPDMVDFYDEYSDDVEIVAVNLTQTETNKEDIPAFLDEFGVDFTVLRDEVSSVAEDIFSVYVMPTSYIIDREGKIVNIAQGPLTYDLMENVFNDIE